MMRHRPDRLLMFAAVGVLVACAPAMRWDKAGTTDDDIVLARQDCEAAAAAELRSDYVRRRDWFQGHTVDGLRIDQPAVERRFQEAEYRRLKAGLFAQCMQAKGYRLIPADAPKPELPKQRQAPLTG